jgi:hypothetical protein
MRLWQPPFFQSATWQSRPQKRAPHRAQAANFLPPSPATGSVVQQPGRAHRRTVGAGAPAPSSSQAQAVADAAPDGRCAFSKTSSASASVFTVGPASAGNASAFAMLLAKFTVEAVSMMKRP